MCLTLCPMSSPIAFSSKGNLLELLEVCEPELSNTSLWDQRGPQPGSKITLAFSVLGQISP